MALLLDGVLDAASDIELALDLAERLGWQLYHVDTNQPWSGAYFVMLVGSPGPCINLSQHKPEIHVHRRYSNATFKSFYGAVVLALLRGLAGERQMDVDVAKFKAEVR